MHTTLSNCLSLYFYEFQHSIEMYQKIREPVENDFQKVNKFIVEQLHSEVSLVESIGHYIVEAGGKRMRPILVLLAAKGSGIESELHIPMAAVIEFIHTATLLHDDVVDMSQLRRGRPTVNSEWNNPSSVLVGDFIYSRAFQILVKISDMRIMEIIANTTNKIAEGEVLQLIAKSNPEPSEESYMRVITNKTAILFQAAAQCGAILAKSESNTEQALQSFGMQLGIAFQLIDDVLDYSGNTDELGKNIGDDLAEGKSTLPLIYALRNGSASQRDAILKSLNAEKLSKSMLENVIEIVQNSGGINYTKNLAKTRAETAAEHLNSLPASKYRDSLKNMVEFSITRKS